MSYVWIYLATGFFFGIAVTLKVSENIKSVPHWLALMILAMLTWPGILLFWLFP